MRIENAFDVPLPPEDAWRVLLDIERVAPCLPGAELLATIDDKTYKGRDAARLGPVAVSFEGTARFEDIDAAARRCRVKASGTETKGRGGAQATVEFVLTPAAPRLTHVAIVTDLTLNGAVAQYGRGAAMIADVAQQMVNRFAETLKIQIEGSEFPSAPPPRPRPRNRSGCSPWSQGAVVARLAAAGRRGCGATGGLRHGGAHDRRARQAHRGPAAPHRARQLRRRHPSAGHPRRRAFLRASAAHARIRSIDTHQAAAMPGVRAILTAADLPTRMRAERMPMLVPNAAITDLVTQYCLARDEVCYVGEPIAFVIADTRHRAEDALAAIVVDAELLPAVSDCRAAVVPGAPRCRSDAASNVAGTFAAVYGDIDAAFRAAPHVFREEMWQHRGCGHALEARAVLAQHDPADGMLTMWSATQTPHLAKSSLADLLGRDPETIRVIAPDVGGGFGPKAVFYAEEAVVAAAALALGRPVKWTEDRREHFLAANQERDQYWSVEIAVGGDGKLHGVRGTLLHDTGAYVPWGIIMPFIAAATVPGPYVLPAYRLEVTVAYTNKVATSPVRGAGRPQAVFAMERLMDRAARELGLDPAEIRRRNFIQPAQMPYPVGLTFRDGKPLVYDSGDYPACQATALALARYGDFPARQMAARAAGRFIGIGIGNYVEGTGLGPFEGVTVRVLQDGRVAVRSGAAPQGQGHKTTLAQICAERLDVPMERIAVTVGDSAAIAMGVGTFAGRRSPPMLAPLGQQGADAGAQRKLPPRACSTPTWRSSRSRTGGWRYRAAIAAASASASWRASPRACRASFPAGEQGGASGRHRIFRAVAGRLLQRHPRRRGRGRHRHRRGAHPQLRGRP